ncbi:hypothetical protein [Haloferula rosea]|uniref:Uncharacterized protein n=1 Tax=Haloferula rosea TaxID=490093 RepID=A0A934VEF1_9BACT|nr:hypothetical protein [Haloferula rosea]MBK1825976.1 hypothetical protein [Haloferula rosea]
MEAQESQDFNQRLSQWIASQGFWFQLRHSLSSGGGWSGALFHLLRMGFKVLLLMVVIGLGFGYYLVKRVDSQAFRDGIVEGLGETIGAEKTEVSGFKRIQGKAMIRRVGAEGGEQSFFESLEARYLTFDMGMLDGVLKEWDAGVIECNQLDVELKAGASSAEAANWAAESFFARDPNFLLRGIESTTTRISWGYFERAYGGIRGSKMTANRVGDGWRFGFKGGTFSQNWMRDFKIEDLVVYCSPDGGMVVEKGEFAAGDGKVEFRNVKAVGGERPVLSGSILFSRVPLREILPGHLETVVSGTVSGEFEIGGSTNSAEGVTFAGRVELDGRDTISVRRGFRLFEALDVVDVFNTYRRVDFDEGGFDLKTGRGVLELSGLDLTASGLMSMQGRMTIRRPEGDEIERLVGGADAVDGAMSGLGVDKESELTMTLKKAAEAEKKAETGENVDEENEKFFSEMGEARRLRREQMERTRRAFLFEGGVRIMIPGDAFERSRVLRERFPVDQATGQIGIDVPLEGTLNELTTQLAEEILRLGTVD